MEAQPKGEIVPKEVDNHLDDKAAFVTRFLISPGALDPETSQYIFTEGSIVDIMIEPASLQAKNFYCADRASEAECTEYWKTRAQQGKPLSYEEQMTTWIGESAEVLSSADVAEKTKKLKQVLQSTGSHNFDEEVIIRTTAATILENVQRKYFQSQRVITRADGTTETLAVDTRRFVTDTLAAYRTGGNLNTERLFKDLEDIKWFCRIFGDQHMDQIMTDITAAVAEQEKHRAQILNVANTKIGETSRISKDNMKLEEKEELTYLAGYAKYDFKPTEAPQPPEPPETPKPPKPVVPVPLPKPTPNDDEDNKDGAPLPPPKGEEKERKKKELEAKIAEANKEIFDKAGTRDRAQMTALMADVREAHEQMLQDGNGKLPPTIQDAETKGFTDIVCDGGVTYIPRKEGEIIAIGDLHGDFAALRQIITETKFIENMEGENPSQTLVIVGDMIDRGKKSVQTMEAVLELKRRYPKNVIIMRADHEELGGTTDQDAPQKMLDHYYSRDGIPADILTSLSGEIKAIIDRDQELKRLAQGGLLSEEDVKTAINRIYTKQTSYDQACKDLTGKLTRQEDQKTVRRILSRVHMYIAENNPLVQELYTKTLNRFPRLVACGNKAIFTHGGPTYGKTNLEELSRIRGQQFSDTFDDTMTWADPDPEAGSHETEGNQLIQEVDSILAKTKQQNQDRVMYNNQQWRTNNLMLVRQRVAVAIQNGFWFNPERTRERTLPAAIWKNMVTYGEKGLNGFLTQLGGTVMIRGHQVSREVIGGKPNPFPSDILWTLHSTGKGSPDSAYQGREFHPSYAVLDRNTSLTAIDPKKHVRPVWTKHKN